MRKRKGERGVERRGDDQFEEKLKEKCAGGGKERLRKKRGERWNEIREESEWRRGDEREGKKSIVRVDEGRV